jgi:hypothetical protein
MPLNSFPAFHVTRRFNIEFTTALHLFLSWARQIQSTSPHPTSPRSILILSTHLCLGLPSGLFPSGFPTNNLYTFSSPHSCYMTRPSHPPWLDYSDYTWRRVQITKLLAMQFFSILPSPHPSSVQISSLASCSQTPSVCVPPLMTHCVYMINITYQNYWVSGPCPLSEILNTRKRSKTQ